MKVAVLIISSLLIGCASQPMPPDRQTEIDLHIHWRTPEQVTELTRIYNKQGQYRGLSIWNKENNRCDIFLPRPEYTYDMGTLGHEVFHCIAGEYH